MRRGRAIQRVSLVPAEIRNQRFDLYRLLRVSTRDRFKEFLVPYKICHLDGVDTRIATYALQ